jgi:NAD(P)-dependent dehydrogenase (short-subunit alcohol dehydrogenase family)
MLDGRAAIITGGAGGLCRAMAETFLRAGDTVCPQRPERGRRACYSGRAAVVGKVVTCTTDVTYAAGQQRAVERCAKELAQPGVRLNAIQPGLIRTAMTAGLPSAVVAHVHEEQFGLLRAAIWRRVEDEVEPAGVVGEVGDVQA